MHHDNLPYRRCVVPDLGDDLTCALEVLEEVLSHLASGLEDGPRWFGPDGRHEHAPLRFVAVEWTDLATLAAAAAAVDRALHRTGAPDLAEALESSAAAADVAAVDVVTALATVHGILSIASTRDVERMYAAADAAGSR